MRLTAISWNPGAAGAAGAAAAGAGAAGFDQIDAAVAVGIETLKDIGSADNFRRRQTQIDMLDLNARLRRARDRGFRTRLRLFLVMIDRVLIATRGR